MFPNHRVHNLVAKGSKYRQFSRLAKGRGGKEGRKETEMLPNWTVLLKGKELESLMPEKAICTGSYNATNRYLLLPT